MNKDLSFGALSPPLSEQLAGLGLKVLTIRHFQRDADAITRLLVRGLMSESHGHLARGRLARRISEAIREPAP
jgi:hypothetical protein